MTQRNSSREPVTTMSGTFSSIADDFVSHARRHPLAEAVVMPGRRVSYREIEHRAGAIQHDVERSDPVGGPVAILAEDAAVRAAAILGVVAAGRAFALTDPKHSPDALLAAAEQIGARTAIGSAPPHEFSYRVAVADLNEGHLRPRPSTASMPFAYVPTSGSTGDPRYVLRTHAATHQTPGSTLDLGPADRAFRPFNYSGAAMTELLSCLASGACHLSLDPLQTSPSETLGFLEAERVTTISGTPSMLRLMLRSGGAASEATLPNLRAVDTTGEPLPWSDVVTLRSFGPSECVVRHRYSSSETRTVTLRSVRFGERIGEGHVPAGYPVPGRRIWIDTGDGQPAAPGVIGTIVIEGRFGTVGPSFEELPDGMLRFRSGDVGELTTDGELIHHGRSDGVVKIGAVRIDPGVVEDVLRRVPGVNDVCIVHVQLDAGGVRLIAHVVADEKRGLEAADLRKYAVERLASNAVPARFIFHDCPFPLLASGKTDVRALKAPNDAAS